MPSSQVWPQYLGLPQRAGRLYAIVDVEMAASAGWTPLDLVSAYLSGGAHLIQLRAKSLSGSAFLDLACRMHDLTAAAGALLIVNDRADIARSAGAEGVHVGQDDLPPAAVRRLVGLESIVGLSSHTDEQVLQAITEPISYMAIGPVFTTATKNDAQPPIGLIGVRQAAKAAAPRALGVIGIGGITLARAREVVDAGAAGVAVISDLLAGGDPEARTRAFIARLAEVGTV